MLSQVGEEALQRVGHGVESGQEKQEADAENLVVGQLVPTDLGRSEHAEEVVLGLFAAVGQGLGEESLDLAGVHPLVGLDLFEVVAGRAQDAVLHLQEHVQLRHGQPE